MHDLFHFYTLILLIFACSCQTVSVQSDDNDSTKKDQSTFRPPTEFDLFIREAFVNEGDLLVGNPCDPNPCMPSETCKITPQNTYLCEAEGCLAIRCAQNEICIESPTGPSCRNLRCQQDTDCLENEFCNDSQLCQGQSCVPQSMKCVGNQVWQCKNNGAQEEIWTTCDEQRSVCMENQGQAYCTCSDDWDCPNFMVCENGQCLGAPRAPICQLPPVPFEQSLPKPEIVWGGTIQNPVAANSPYSKSVQVVMTPVVSPLTDDNQDGQIDENDDPKILFLSFCNQDATNNGILRAIHGGGPKKGQDFFAIFNNQRWLEGEPMPQVDNCVPANINSTATIAVANLDDPEIKIQTAPEIITMHEDEGILIYDHLGNLLLEALVGQLGDLGKNPSASVANVDQKGMAEIIVGSTVIALDRDQAGSIKVMGVFYGNLAKGINSQGPISCVANLLDDSQLEIIAGSSVYRMPTAPMNATSQADCQQNGGAIVPANADETAWCAKELLVVWDGKRVSGASAQREGFCAVADVLGVNQDLQPNPSNPLDGLPELVVISAGKLQIFNGQTGQLKVNRLIAADDFGGAPNIDDFDGDGFPEIGSAFASAYVMMELQEPTTHCPEWKKLTDQQDSSTNPVLAPVRNPGPAQCNADADCMAGEGVCKQGKCICLHNSWKRKTEDDSSKVTGSTLFDFNGDGATEVIYNDECWFRIYDGATGKVLLKEASESRTRIENPLVADVDNDGNAEIVFSTSTESGYCSERNNANPNGGKWKDQYNAGIEVWGDPTDQWVSARRIWNQHAYHITNITETAQVPAVERDGWVSQNGRFYNSYRSQPRNFGVAPDLTISQLSYRHISSCLADSNLVASLSYLLINQGDLRVGAGINLSYEGQWTENGPWQALLDAQGMAIFSQTQQILNAGQSLRIDLSYDALSDPQSNQQLPIAVRVKADQVEGNAIGAQRECIEDNNERTETLQGIDQQLSDLEVKINQVTPGDCYFLSLQVEVKNTGEPLMAGTEVALYVGIPGDAPVRVDQRMVNALQSGETQVIDWGVGDLPYSYAQGMSIFVSVDPQNLVLECDEEDNLFVWESEVQCMIRD